MINNKKPPHPGVLFKRDFLVGEMTLQGFADTTKFSRQYWGDVLNGRKRVTAILAIDMEKVSGVRAEDWAMTQARYDVWAARKIGKYRR